MPRARFEAVRRPMLNRQEGDAANPAELADCSTERCLAGESVDLPHRYAMKMQCDARN